jgi:thiol-disulfide isomerase/thioredoxin
MKKKATLFFASIFLSGFLIAQTAFTLFQEVPDAEEKKYLLGFISKEQITKDPDFGWYAQNSKYYKPKKEHVDIITKKAYDFQILLFTGTWCHDSQQIIPKYFSLLEAAEFPDHRMVIVGVDRQKAVPGNLHRPLNIVNVPTLIVLKEGVEVGRVVEYGNTGMVDAELAEIIKKIN